MRAAEYFTNGKVLVAIVVEMGPTVATAIQTNKPEEGNAVPLTKCPYCGRLLRYDASLLGQYVGCMNNRCEMTYQAKEYRRHSGGLSQFVFFAVIAFAVFLLVVWTDRTFHFTSRLLGF